MSGLVYPLWSYGRMIADRQRMEAYAEALRRTIRPGDLVFDLGAGPGGFAVLACRYGARKAVAIEVDPSVRLAPAIAAAEGLEGRVEIFHGRSTDYVPDERADVIVADLRGSLPMYGAVIPALADARKRLLKPGGTLIPMRDRLVVALVESVRQYRSHVTPWRRNRLGLKLGSLRRFVTNHQRPCWLPRRALLSAPALIAELDYATIEDPDVEASLTLTATRAGIAHGVAIWFETDLVDGVGFSTGPETPSTVYRHIFFPFEEPLRRAAGEALELTIAAKLIDGDYHWFWRTVARSPDGSVAHDFRQASDFARLYAYHFGGQPDESTIPAPAERRDLDLFCLDRLDGRRSLGEIADALHSRFPGRFDSRQSALDYVAEFAQEYARLRNKDR